MKYAFIDEMAGEGYWWLSVALACELLGVSRSGFYDWRARRTRPATAREREQLLLAAIVVEHIASKRRYGSPRIHAELQDQGWRVGVNRIARLMAREGIEGRSSRRRRRSLTGSTSTVRRSETGSTPSGAAPISLRWCRSRRRTPGCARRWPRPNLTGRS